MTENEDRSNNNNNHINTTSYHHSDTRNAADSDSDASTSQHNQHSHEAYATNTSTSTSTSTNTPTGNTKHNNNHTDEVDPIAASATSATSPTSSPSSPSPSPSSTSSTSSSASPSPSTSQPHAAAIKCTSTNCQSLATTLTCPVCIQYNITPISKFCSQACFKSFWKQHQQEKHYKYQQEAQYKAPPFAYTSALRPHYVTKQISYTSIPKHIQLPDYAMTGVPRSEQIAKQEENRGLIPIYNAEEIKGIREACLRGRLVLDYAHSLIRPGLVSDDLDQLIHDKCLELDCYPSPLNYWSFPKSVCISVNEVICHGIPDMRALQTGDIVNIDISVYHKGYHGDLNETYAVGEIDSQSQHLLRTSYQCLMKAIQHCKPLNYCRDFGDIIQKHATKNCCSVVKSYCGHGIGKLFHCAPSIPHYNKNKAVGQLKSGMIFTIEPMINAGDWRDVTWPDQWTSVTKDGKRSAQFEHTILITDNGYEILTARLATSPPLDYDLNSFTIT